MAEEMHHAANGLACVVGQDDVATFSQHTLATVYSFLEKLQMVFPSMIDQNTWDQSVEPMLARWEKLSLSILANGGENLAEDLVLKAIAKRCRNMRDDGLAGTIDRAMSEDSFPDYPIKVEISMASTRAALDAQVTLTKKEATADDAATLLLSRLTYQLIAIRERPDELVELSPTEVVRLTNTKAAFVKHNSQFSTPICAAALALCELHKQSSSNRKPENGMEIHENARQILADHGLDPADYLLGPVCEACYRQNITHLRLYTGFIGVIIPTRITSHI
jgi:hypothetical protein